VKIEAVLDVGCGSRPKGTVNVDLRANVESQHLMLTPRQIPNFFHGKGELLPFRDNAFDKVICHHVIEHVEEPLRFLSELLRVSKSVVELRCPHRLSQNPLKRSKHHKNFFNATWFRKTLRKNKKVKGFMVEITKYKPFPSYLFSFCVFPYEITVTVFLR